MVSQTGRINRLDVVLSTRFYRLHLVGIDSMCFICSLMQLNVVNAKYEPRVKSSVEHARGGPRGSISRGKLIFNPR